MPRLKGRGPRRTHPAFPPEPAVARGKAGGKTKASKRMPSKEATAAEVKAAPRGAEDPRITFDPSIFGGKPILRGRRLAVEHVLGLLAAGETIDGLLVGYPWLERDDVLACLAFAFTTVRDKHKPKGFVLL